MGMFDHLRALLNHLGESRGPCSANAGKALNMIHSLGPRLSPGWLGKVVNFVHHTPLILGCLCLYLSHMMNTKSLGDQHHQIQEHITEIQKKITTTNQHLHREKTVAAILKNLRERGAFQVYSHFEMATAIYEVATKHHIEIDSNNFRIYPDQITFSNKEIEIKKTPMWILIKSTNLENMNDFIAELKKKYLVAIRQDLERSSFKVIWYSVLLQDKINTFQTTP